MNNLENRLAALDASLKREAQKAEKKKEEEEKEKIVFTHEILELSDRVKELLSLAQALDAAGKLAGPKRWATEKSIRDGFVADGFYHNWGVTKWNERYGFGVDTGWNSYVLFFDGNEIVKYDQYNKCAMVPSLWDLKNILSEYTMFEKRFYTWFDETFGTEKENV